VEKKVKSSIFAQIKVTFECSNNKLAEIIHKGLEPENKLSTDETKITSTIKENEIILIIESTSPVSSIRRTIDDVLHTVTLIENTYKTATEN